MANRKEESNEVILQRVRPRGVYRDKGSDEAQQGIGKTRKVSADFVKRNRKLIEREGYKIVNPEILNSDAKRNESQKLREQASQERKEEIHSDSNLSGPTEPKLSDGQEIEVEITASKAAQRLADEHGIALETVKGTGKGGNITKSDVQKLI